jgi:SpoVK/Ycf46/Vps4 family AAA+-type ATPase
VLPELAAQAGELAARHAVEPADAMRIASDARARARLDGRDCPRRRDVAESAAVRSAGALPAGVTVRRPRASWDSLVLSHERLSQLRAAIDRLRHQALVLDEWGFLRERPGARGVRMLLSGPPGTGKTLSAEVLAGALGVDLMIVDISRILSKWIGETEQRLADVFDAAEPGHSVLLFDEADALFGKRTEVSDAHDRYANVETAYLLQRLERFEGLAILTTNLRNNIDEAFTRRIEFVVELADPGPAEREALWFAHLPATAPLAEDLHTAELAARYPVVGGVIRNASVAAAFLAAQDAGPITREHVLLALEREYEKHGRAFPGRPPLSRRANHAIPAQGA